MSDLRQNDRIVPQAAVDTDADLLSQGGVRIRVAQAHSRDVAEIGAFFRYLTPEDLRFRFLGTVKEVSDAQIAAIVDDANAVTFLARDSATGALIAVATLAQQPGSREAEVALSTRPEWKHRGVSWTLLEHVLSYAQAHGYRSVSSLEAGENREAVKLEREMGFVARLSSAEPVELICSKRLGED